MPMTIEHAEDHYLNGGCAAFAFALWLAHGRPMDAMIGIIASNQNEPFSDAIPFDCTHAYYDAASFEMDVCGARGTNKMAYELGLEDWDLVGPYAPNEFLALFTTCAGADHPLNASSAEIAAALEFIGQHPGRYGLSAPS